MTLIPIGLPKHCYSAYFEKLKAESIFYEKQPCSLISFYNSESIVE